MRVHVRTAVPDDALDVRRILDAAMLEPGDVEARIDERDVLVAGDRQGRPDTGDETTETDDRERILGAIVLVPRETEGGDEGSNRNERSRQDVRSERDKRNENATSDDERGAHISAIGVRRRHRNRGIGRALVERALERERRVTARFDADVRPFYDSLGFAIEQIDERRFRGVAVASDADASGDTETDD